MWTTEMVNVEEATLLSMDSKQKVRHSKQLVKLNNNNNELLHIEFKCIETLSWLLPGMYSLEEAEVRHSKL